MEAISLGALISSEVQHKTITALLVTRAGLGHVLAAKGILGASFAFTEAAIVLLLIRGFGPSPGIVLSALVLGAILVTGIAMITWSAGKDLMGTMMFSLLFMIPLMIPPFAVLFPGSMASWIQILPSYGLVRIILGAGLEGAGWAESARHFFILAGWCAAFAVTGLLVLKRRVQTL